MTLLVLIATPLSGCFESDSGTTPGKLPPVPADIQSCFREALPMQQPRAFTVAEVESLWKDDRIRNVVLRQCGNRFLEWYNSLRRGWK